MTRGEKLLLFLFFSTATIRLFTEEFPILPRWFQFIEFLLLPLFVVVVLVRIATARRITIHASAWFLLVAAFAGVWLISAVANLGDIYWPAALLFLAGHLLPIVFAVVLLNMPMNAAEFGRRFTTAMITFGVIEVAVSIFQLRDYFSQIDLQSESDALSGTYGFNADQLAVVMCLPALLLIERQIARVASKREWLLLPMFIALLYMASMKALWVLFPVTFVMLLVLLGSRDAIKRGGAVAALALASFLAMTRLTPAWLGRFEHILSPSILAQQGKVRTFLAVPNVLSQRAWAPLIGIGPGTFSSRAFRTFGAIDEGNAGADTRSPTAGFAGAYLPPLAEKYLVPLLPTQSYGGFGEFGSIKTAGPFSSYTSLVIETGLLGSGIMFAIYAIAFLRLRRIYRRSRAAGDGELRALAFAASGGLVLLAALSVLDNYLELTRVTVAVWIFVVAAIVRGRALRVSARGLVARYAYDRTTKKALSGTSAA